MTENKRHAIRAHYVPRIEPNRPNFDILDWASPESQQKRFEVLTRFLDVQGKTLLDVGCGLGDLRTFLQNNEIDLSYTGVDLVEEMLAKSQSAHEDAEFLLADIFGADDLGGRKFDIVFCSGTLNLNLGNNLIFLAHALPKMLSLANEHLVFNLLSTRSSFREEDYFFYRPDDATRILEPLCKSIELVDDYLDGDFSFLCRPK